MNYLLDNNFIIDILSERRRKKYPKSVKVYNIIQNEDNNIFISSSSLDNIEFILFKEIKAQFDYSNKEALSEVHKRIKSFMKDIKIAKTPSYIDIDYEDIEDSQLVASAKAIDAKIITRDDKLIKKYPNLTITPDKFLSQYTNNQYTNPPSIDFANLKKQYFLYQNEFEKEIDKVLNSARYIMGDPIKDLEENLANFTGAKYAISCGSGTDALILALMAIDIKPGDEVITTPFTFIATAEAIALLKAKPVFVDIDEKTYNIDAAKIEEKITPKTKAIIPVSLYGQPSDLEKINQYTHNKYTNQPIHIIIDGAQSFGATYKGKSEVHYCDIYTTSFFPAKPLGCFGDGGAVLTNNEELAQKIRSLRVHGQIKRYYHKYIGMNARMDTIQAAVLNVKLKHYPDDLKKREEVARKYSELLKNSDKITIPTVKSDRTSAWAQYSIRVKNRDELKTKLSNIPITNNQYTTIPTAIHYPMPLHLQECFKDLEYKEGDFPVAEKVSKEILSLPMNPYLKGDEIKYVADTIKNAE